MAIEEQARLAEASEGLQTLIQRFMAMGDENDGIREALVDPLQMALEFRRIAVVLRHKQIIAAPFALGAEVDRRKMTGEGIELRHDQPDHAGFLAHQIASDEIGLVAEKLRRFLDTSDGLRRHQRAALQGTRNRADIALAMLRDVFKRGHPSDPELNSRAAMDIHVKGKQDCRGVSVAHLAFASSIGKC